MRTKFSFVMPTVICRLNIFKINEKRCPITYSYPELELFKIHTENERLQTRSNFDQKDHDLLRLNAKRKSSSFCIHGGECTTTHI